MLHAGEVSSNSSSITGNVIDNATTSAINGGTTIVALEQKDASGVDRVIMQTTADANGNFVLCPVSDSTYDVVVDAVDNSGKVFAATITTGVQAGNTLSNVPLIATTGPAAALTGQVNTQAGSNAPTSADVSISALQAMNSVLFTVPLPSQSTTAVRVTTLSSGTCAANSECASYTLTVPVANPNIGAFGSTYTQASGAVNYTLDGIATVPSTPATPDCSPQDVQVTVSNVVSNAGAKPLNFSGCQ
jgi:hypothetical protein